MDASTISVPSDNEKAPRFARDVLVPFIITRGVMAALIVIAFRICLPKTAVDWPTILSHLDGIWYLRIVRDGYFFDPAGQSSIAFAPLFPMLMRWLAPLFGGGNNGAVWAGVAIANVALLLALTCVVAMTQQQFGNRAARRMGWYVLICPGTIFLSAVYPMSLMLAISAAALLAAQRGRWGIAGAIGMLAPLVRPDGALLFIPLLIVAWRMKASVRESAWLLLVPAGACAWLLAQWLAFGTPIAFIHAQQAWEPSPLITVLHSGRAPLILGTAGFFLLLAVIGLFRLPIDLSIYSALFLAIILESGRMWSLPRFVVILFPCFMTLAWLGARWKWLHAVYVTTAVLLAAVFTMRFGIGLWVA